MYKTEIEIFTQTESLKKTVSYLNEVEQSVREFFGSYKKVVFVGCGSGFAVCQSAARTMTLQTDLCAFAVAAGDAMINFSYYRRMFKDAVIIAPSRSGSTSEVIRLVKRAKKEFDTPLLSITAKPDSELSRLAQLDICLPWAFDESVCQTRTVTCFYTAHCMIIGLLAQNEELIEEVQHAVLSSYDFLESHRETCKAFVENTDWKHVMVLSDADLAGIGVEASLAFKEIAQLHSNHEHVLDARHGPFVLFDAQTFVLCALSPQDETYQKAMIQDIEKRGCTVMTVGDFEQPIHSNVKHLTTPAYRHYCVYGIALIMTAQMIALFKALSDGTNPDEPHGLDPWIQL